MREGKQCRPSCEAAIGHRVNECAIALKQWNRVKSVDKNKSFVIHNNVILYQKGLTPSKSLNRIFQRSLQLHFVWIDVVGAVSNINLFKLMLSAEFTTPFHLNWCYQQSLQLHFIWIDVVSRVYNSILLKLMLSNVFLASFHFFSVVKRFLS